VNNCSDLNKVTKPKLAVSKFIKFDNYDSEKSGENVSLEQNYKFY